MASECICEYAILTGGAGGTGPPGKNVTRWLPTIINSARVNLKEFKLKRLDDLVSTALARGHAKDIACPLSRRKNVGTPVWPVGTGTISTLKKKRKIVWAPIQQTTLVRWFCVYWTCQLSERLPFIPPGW